MWFWCCILFMNNCIWFANIFFLFSILGSTPTRKLELYFLTEWFLYYVFWVCFNYVHDITFLPLLQDHNACSPLCLHSTLNSPLLQVWPPLHEIKGGRMLSNCSFAGSQWSFLNIKRLFYIFWKHNQIVIGGLRL